MTCTLSIPQGDYFEWDDVITNNIAYAHQVPYLHDHSYSINNSSNIKSWDYAPSSQLSASPIENQYFHWGEIYESSTPTKTKDISSELISPILSENDALLQPENCESDVGSTLPSAVFTRDDSHLLTQPTQNVDYLSFPWHHREADLWASRKYLHATKRSHDREDQVSERLINAIWRTTAMNRLNLGKVDPRSFNWSKDQDDTWLHGPYLNHYETQAREKATDISLSVKKSSILNFDSDEYPVRSILKYASPATLLARGSIVPSSIPYVRKDSRSHTCRKKQRKTLRFSSEVQQYVTLPEDSIKSASNAICEAMHAEKGHSPQQSDYPHQADVCFAGYSQLSSPRAAYKNPRSPGIRKSTKRTAPPTVCQISSARLRNEQVSGDMAVLRCALRDVVDSRHTRSNRHEVGGYHTEGLVPRSHNMLNEDTKDLGSHNCYHEFPFDLHESDKMDLDLDWPSGKKISNEKTLYEKSISSKSLLGQSLWNGYDGTRAILLKDSLSINTNIRSDPFPDIIPSGLQSPPELSDSHSGSVSGDDIDEEMEEYNLILG